MNPRPLQAPWVFLVVLLSGCTAPTEDDDAAATSGTGPGSTTSGASNAATGADAVAFETIDQGSQSQRPSEGESGLVFPDNSTWTAFWRNHTGNSSSEAPGVDFETRFVVAVLLGQQTTSGYAVTIERVTAQGEHYAVDYSRSKPGPTCVVAAVITNPYHIVAVGRGPEPNPTVTFNAEDWATNECA